MHDPNSPTSKHTWSDPRRLHQPPLESSFAIKTWRYLRLSMVLLVLGLAEVVRKFVEV